MFKFIKRLNLRLLYICFYMHSLCALDEYSYKNLIRAKDPNLNIGVYVVMPENNTVICSKHKDRLFIPASNTKLFTAAAALDILGVNFCFETTLLTDGVLQGQSVEGNVYVKASGDPSFTKNDLTNLFAQLKKQSIDTITGDICIDLSIFEDDPKTYYGNGFCVDDIGCAFNAPISPCIIDENLTTSSNGHSVALTDPEKYLISLIPEILRTTGISLLGTIKLSYAPGDNTIELARHSSNPLSDLVKKTLKESDNLYANAIFKQLAVHHSGKPGTWAKGKKALEAFLCNELEIAKGTFVVEDGAGLSRYNLLSPAHLVKLLLWIYKKPALYHIFFESLPIAGVDGTLKKRFQECKGLVRAKTGTMTGISALSGYLYLNNRTEPIVFSCMLNGFIQRPIQTDGQAPKLHIQYKTDIEDALCLYVMRTAAVN